jgi:SprT-like family
MPHLGVMSESGSERCLNRLRRHVRSWLALWGIGELDQTLSIEWSSRLSRSLGRAFPRQGLVRLSPLLMTARREILLEAVCHEVAHVAVPRLHSRPSRPHGPEWAELVRAAGFPCRIRVPFVQPLVQEASVSTSGDESVVPLRRRRTSTSLYVHTCPVCHARRVAGRRISRWRCAECVAAGLDGRLTVAVLKARSS